MRHFRFNATAMLNLIRGKRLVFVGDSINRNQWESMLCLLMGAIKDPKRVYEARGRRITKEKGNYCFKFLVSWSAFPSILYVLFLANFKKFVETQYLITLTCN